MKLEIYKQTDQLYILPTIKVTYNRSLNGYYEIIFAWGFGGISIMF